VLRAEFQSASTVPAESPAKTPESKPASPTGFEGVQNVDVGGISSEIEGGQVAGPPLDLARNPSISRGVSHSVSHSESSLDHRAELAQALVRALGRAIEGSHLASRSHGGFRQWRA
jgi:hypothetical protein